MNIRNLVWSSLVICLCLTSPIYGKVNGFKEVEKKKYEKDTWHTYEHVQSGLKVIWIENNDVNKSFVVGVKTPTENDTGVNHIIEHTVFTGSSAYPSPSVFFDASEAYPSTYMNALTSGDMTIFPFSTPYISCYNALRQIYLDAIFKPKLLEQPYGFYEEGFHRVPEENRYGGVVYNEMKGAYSSIDRSIYRALRQTVYADTAYAFDSGGNPNAIPTLTYEAFVDTYNRYYYPGNMKIIVYGDLPIDETLSSIAAYVEEKEKKDDIQLKVEGINEVHTGSYTILPTQDKACLVKAFVIKEGVTAKELQELDLWMSAYLMSPQAYFQGNLLSKGIRAKWLKDDDVPYPIYAIVATDIPTQKVDQYSIMIDQLIKEAPKHLQQNVFLEQDILKEAKWRLEKQETSNNRGITIAQSILDGWAHDREEAQYYIMKKQLEKMKGMDGNISNLLFKESTQYTLTLLPGQYQLENPEEHSPISTNQWTKIYKEIEDWQTQKSTLEPIDLSTLVIGPEVIPTISKKENYWEMESRVDTNLARSTLYLNTSHINQEELPYLYLYSYLLEESAKDITPFSGSITAHCTAYPSKEGYWPCFKLSIITSLEEKEHGVLFNQARNYLRSRPESWYRQKLIELTLGMKGSSQSNALATLSQLTLGKSDERGAYLYQQSYPLYIFCQQLIQIQHNTWINHIKQIDETLYHTGGTILATTLPQKGENQCAKSWEKVLAQFETLPNLKGKYQFEIPEAPYIVYSGSDVDHSYINLFKPEGIGGSDYLLAAYLTKHYLNPQIRVKMGAYGAGCQIYDLQTIGIYTYRDPDYRSSLPIIRASSQCLGADIDEGELELSKAEALSKVHRQYKLLATPLEQSIVMEHLILWGRSPKEIINLEKDIMLSDKEIIKMKKEAFEKAIDEGEIAIMTKKSYSGGQNFTIYRY